MKFTWTLEDLKLKDKGYKDFEQMAKDMTTEELENAIDEYGNNRYSTSFYKEMREQFQNDVKADLIKRSTYGSFNMNSLKAWRRKNGLTTSYSYDYELEGLGFMGFRNFMSFKLNDEQMRNGWEYTFIKMCESLRSKEQTYFNEHDEYTILEKEVGEFILEFGRLETITIKGVNIWCGSSFSIVEEDENGYIKNRRKATMEELRTLKEYFLGLRKVIDEYKNANIINFTF